MAKICGTSLCINSLVTSGNIHSWSQELTSETQIVPLDDMFQLSITFHYREAYCELFGACTSCDENDLEGLRVWHDQLSVEIRIASWPGNDTLMVLRDEVGFMSFPECVWQTRYLLMNRCIEIENKMEKVIEYLVVDEAVVSKEL